MASSGPGAVAVVLEAVGGDDPEPGAAALFLVGGDPLPLAGEHGVQRQQPGERLGERGAAHLAPVVARRDLVVVAAAGAAVRLVGDDLARRVRRQLDPVDLVPGALVVDQGAAGRTP